MGGGERRKGYVVCMNVILTLFSNIFRSLSFFLFERILIHQETKIKLGCPNRDSHDSSILCLRIPLLSSSPLLQFFLAVKMQRWFGNLGKNKQMAGGPHTFAHRETNLFVLASAIRA